MRRDLPGTTIGKAEYLKILDAALERARRDRPAVGELHQLRGETPAEFRARLRWQS